jgi:hypothetical protein
MPMMGSPLLLSLTLIAALTAPPPVRAVPSPAPLVRGVSLGLFSHQADWDYGDSVREIAALGATDLLVALAWYQPDGAACEIARRAGYTPSDEAIRRTIRQARTAGLRVALLPIVRLTVRNGDWRGTMAPACGAERWFEAYRDYILHVATLAQSAGATRFFVGSELSSMEEHVAAWRALVRDVRSRYSGRVAYAANWDHFQHVAFWDAVDEAAVSAYFELGTDAAPRPDDAALAATWGRLRTTVSAWAASIDRPVLFSEIGYPATSWAARRPWDDVPRADSQPDPAEQARLYDAFCEAWVGRPDVPWFAGFYVWNWFGAGGPADAGYTPRGKPAAARLRACLGRGARRLE